MWPGHPVPSLPRITETCFGRTCQLTGRIATLVVKIETTRAVHRCPYDRDRPPVRSLWSRHVGATWRDVRVRFSDTAGSSIPPLGRRVYRARLRNGCPRRAWRSTTDRPCADDGSMCRWPVGETVFELKVRSRAAAETSSQVVATDSGVDRPSARGGGS